MSLTSILDSNLIFLTLTFIKIQQSQTWPPAAPQSQTWPTAPPQSSWPGRHWTCGHHYLLPGPPVETSWTVWPPIWLAQHSDGFPSNNHRLCLPGHPSSQVRRESGCHLDHPWRPDTDKSPGRLIALFLVFLIVMYGSSQWQLSIVLKSHPWSFWNCLIWKC